jgi:hypothetical protein
MCKFVFIVLTASSLSVQVSAQSNMQPKCPAGYDLIRTYCQNNATGDIVLAN